MGWLRDNLGNLILDNAGGAIWVGEQPTTTTTETVNGLQVIAENVIDTVSADSENTNYPDDNVLDTHPKRVWKAASGVTQATIDCVLSDGCNALAVFNTNATAATVNITDPNQITWPDFDFWPDVEWVYVIIDTTVELQQTGTSSSMWVSFTFVDIPLEVSIIFSAATTVEVGVIVVGEALHFKNPQYGLQEGLYDYSILKELSNGAFYHKQRDVVRTFSGAMLLERDDDFYSFMHTVARTNSFSPMAWRVTDLDEFDWVVYARFISQPQGYHAYPSHSPVEFSLIEVL